MVNASFSAQAAETVGEVDTLPIWQQPWVRELAKILAGAAIVIVLLLSIVRPLVRSLTGPPRLAAGVAGTLLAGDCLMLAGTHSFFSEPEVSEALLQRLGEGDLQSLLLLRRQSVDAVGASLSSRIEALKARNRLLVDAHLIWGLADE